MYLAELRIENFRAFGASTDDADLNLSLSPGLNLLVGENDSGKTAIIDAIRHLLWTTSQDYHRLTDDDFHVKGGQRASDLTITATFKKLSVLQQATFLEYLTISEGSEPSLCISLLARRQDAGPAGKRRSARTPSVVFRAGSDAKGPTVEGALREFLRCTYLKPLRDAETELTAGKSSRLSQILKSHPHFGEQAKSDWTPDAPAIPPKTLVGIMKQAEHLIKSNEVVQSVHKEINNEFLADLSLGSEILTAAITVARSADLQQILEKLELALDSHKGVNLPTRRGLGLNNVLFMATELLLLGASEAMPLLLIEEPEAHLHPQMQLRLMEMLELRAAEPALASEGKAEGALSDESEAVDDDAGVAKSDRVQVVVTTHSPVLASKADVESLTLITQHRAFSLASSCTRLDKTGYPFLRRFLDSTKANLFFAKSVVVVEGDGENILLPAIAAGLGRSFSKYGVSIVNVGHRGLFRYSQIFQRRDDRVIPVPVACIADRDVPPAAAKSYVPAPKPPKSGGEPKPKFADEFTPEELKAKEDALRWRDGDPVRTFISPSWTLEHDLALSGLAGATHRAISLACKSRSKSSVLDPEEAQAVRVEADGKMAEWTQQGNTKAGIAALVYEALFDGSASKAETAQFLVEEIHREKLSPADLAKRLPRYLVEAIEYVTKPLPEARSA